MRGCAQRVWLACAGPRPPSAHNPSSIPACNNSFHNSLHTLTMSSGSGSDTGGMQPEGSGKEEENKETKMPVLEDLVEKSGNMSYQSIVENDENKITDENIDETKKDEIDFGNMNMKDIIRSIVDKNEEMRKNNLKTFQEKDSTQKEAAGPKLASDGPYFICEAPDFTLLEDGSSIEIGINIENTSLKPFIENVNETNSIESGEKHMEKINFVVKPIPEHSGQLQNENIMEVTGTSLTRRTRFFVVDNRNPHLQNENENHPESQIGSTEGNECTVNLTETTMNQSAQFIVIEDSNSQNKNVFCADGSQGPSNINTIHSSSKEPIDCIIIDDSDSENEDRVGSNKNIDRPGLMREPEQQNEIIMPIELQGDTELKAKAMEKALKSLKHKIKRLQKERQVEMAIPDDKKYVFTLGTNRWIFRKEALDNIRRRSNEARKRCFLNEVEEKIDHGNESVTGECSGESNNEPKRIVNYIPGNDSRYFSSISSMTPKENIAGGNEQVTIIDDNNSITGHSSGSNNQEGSIIGQQENDTSAFCSNIKIIDENNSLNDNREKITSAMERDFPISNEETYTPHPTNLASRSVKEEESNVVCHDVPAVKQFKIRVKKCYSAENIERMILKQSESVDAPCQIVDEVRSDIGEGVTKTNNQEESGMEHQSVQSDKIFQEKRTDELSMELSEEGGDETFTYFKSNLIKSTMKQSENSDGESHICDKGVQKSKKDNELTIESEECSTFQNKENLTIEKTEQESSVKHEELSPSELNTTLTRGRELDLSENKDIYIIDLTEEIITESDEESPAEQSRIKLNNYNIEQIVIQTKQENSELKMSKNNDEECHTSQGTEDNKSTVYQSETRTNCNVGAIAQLEIAGNKKEGYATDENEPIATKTKEQNSKAGQSLTTDEECYTVHKYETDPCQSFRGKCTAEPNVIINDSNVNDDDTLKNQDKHMKDQSENKGEEGVDLELEPVEMECLNKNNDDIKNDENDDDTLKNQDKPMKDQSENKGEEGVDLELEPVEMECLNKNNDDTKNDENDDTLKNQDKPMKDQSENKGEEGVDLELEPVEMECLNKNNDDTKNDENDDTLKNQDKPMKDQSENKGEEGVDLELEPVEMECLNKNNDDIKNDENDDDRQSDEENVLRNQEKITLLSKVEDIQKHFDDTDEVSEEMRRIIGKAEEEEETTLHGENVNTTGSNTEGIVYGNPFFNKTSTVGAISDPSQPFLNDTPTSLSDIEGNDEFHDALDLVLSEKNTTIKRALTLRPKEELLTDRNDATWVYGDNQPIAGPSGLNIAKPTEQTQKMNFAQQVGSDDDTDEEYEEAMEYSSDCLKLLDTGNEGVPEKDTYEEREGENKSRKFDWDEEDLTNPKKLKTEHEF